MSRIILMAESGSDITPEQAKQNGIVIVPMHVSFGGETRDDGAFPTTEMFDFYKKHRELPRTSGCTPHDFEAVFERLDREYPDASILYLAYSASTTCSMQSALIAGEGRERFVAIDTKSVAAGQAAVVLISTLLLWRFSQGMWRLLPIGWALIPLANSVAFARVPLMPATPESERTKIGTLLKSKAFFIAILMMVASGSAELSMSQWSSLFAEQALGVNKVLGDLLGPCAFALCMAFTRMMYGLHGEKVAVDRALVLSAALCIVCYLTAVLSTIPFLALIGCALCGVSVGLMWPGTVSATARRFPMGGTTLFGLLAISGDIGCSTGPWLTGMISDAVQTSAWGASLMAQLSLSAEQLGLKAGLLVAAVFPVLLLVCALIRARQNRV